MQQRSRLALATATAAVLTGGLLTFTATTATAADSTTVAQADFNGDGIGDVAFSAAGAYVSGLKNAGQVVVLYGTPTGVGAAKRSVLSQDSAGVPGGSEKGDAFGSETAYGDFNHDGYDDLAVGTPHEKVSGDTDGGTVAVLWGSANGLTGKGVTVPDPAASTHDLWGKYLAAGDFDGDGRDDLAVANSSSTVYVYKGGITASGAAGTARSTVKPPVQSGGDTGPLNLTAGDVNGDGRTDLVVDGFETDSEYGWNANYFLPGTASGPSTAAAEKLRPGVITAIGDVNGDGYGDIVSGAYWDHRTADGTTIPNSTDGGRAHLTYGSATGPAGTATLTQDTGNVPGGSEKGDFFAAELDLGDINGDGYQDLVVGAPGEDLGGVEDTGALTVLYGSASGIDTTSGAQFFAQSTAGVPGGDEEYDSLGTDVKLDDVNGDGRADLIAGSWENAGNGSVLLLPSDGTRIVTTGSRTISPSAAGVATTGTPNFGANFAD
ncbi:FG-GAP-like repeat-containing protein [Streptomyces griseoaurantiacus]|uniref:FG-GAP-like repeat-containing protein n=1 Tax=Streptomyces griseoaurantiacus TaxID=68213 RepID=UPI0036BCB164